MFQQLKPYNVVRKQPLVPGVRNRPLQLVIRTISTHQHRVNQHLFAEQEHVSIAMQETAGQMFPSRSVSKMMGHGLKEVLMKYPSANWGVA